MLLWGIPWGSPSLMGCRALLNGSMSPWGASAALAREAGLSRAVLSLGVIPLASGCVLSQPLKDRKPQG